MIRLYNSKPGGSGGGGGVGTLQQVTDLGNVTTNSIGVDNGSADIYIDAGTMFVSNGTHQVTITTEEPITADVTQKWPNAPGVYQASGNGLLLPTVTKQILQSPYTVTRRDYIVQIDLSAGGTFVLNLSNATLAYPGQQIVVKIIRFNPGLGSILNIVPASGTIDGKANISYRCINLFAVTITNDGTNYFVVNTITGAEIVANTAPTITLLAGAGAGATGSVTTGSRDNVGTFNVNFGTGTISGDAFAEIVFARAWPAIPRGIFLMPAFSAGIQVADIGSIWIPPATRTANNFQVYLPSDTTSTFDGLNGEWMYTVVQ